MIFSYFSVHPLKVSTWHEDEPGNSVGDILALKVFVKFGSIDSHSSMRGHMGHPKASQGYLENQLVL
jgi:hypothetical protein